MKRRDENILQKYGKPNTTYLVSVRSIIQSITLRDYYISYWDESPLPNIQIHLFTII